MKVQEITEDKKEINEQMIWILFQHTQAFIALKTA